MTTTKKLLRFARALLAACTVAAFATLVVPVLSADRDDLVRDAALERCSRIAAALEQFERDAGVPLDRTSRLLLGAGGAPAGLPEAPRGRLASLLVQGDPAFGPDWNGPYMMRVDPDPWGRACVATIGADAIWVLSAGPDGRIETRAHDTAPRGDDVGTRRAR